MPAVGSMAIKPGESTNISMEYFMHDAMGGMHNFNLILMTNDPVDPVKTVSIISNWIDLK
jgi:hypothetical protein